MISTLHLDDGAGILPDALRLAILEGSFFGLLQKPTENNALVNPTYGRQIIMKSSCLSRDKIAHTTRQPSRPPHPH